MSLAVEDAGAPVRATRQGWEAELALRFGRVRGRSALLSRRHRGPLRVQRTFLPDPSGPCQVIILHPPGGVVGGDQISVTVDVGDRAEVLVTTPGATRFYRSLGPVSRQHTTLRVARGAFLEWVPQETLFFDRALAETETRVELEEGAHFLGWEIVCLGQPASGRPYDSGNCSLRWEIRRDELPIWIDRGRWVGGEESLTASWGLASYPVMGSLVFLGGEERALDAAREELSSRAIDARVGVTRVGEALVCRVLAHQTRPVLDAFSRLRMRLRRSVSDSPAPAPRIWAT